MADAQTQAPEIRNGKVRLNVLQTVVPAVTAALFETDAARLQIEFVMYDEDLIRENLVETGQRNHRLAGAVHEGCRLEQP